MLVLLEEEGEVLQRARTRVTQEPAGRSYDRYRPEARFFNCITDFLISITLQMKAGTVQTHWFGFV